MAVVRTDELLELYFPNTSLKYHKDGGQMTGAG